jgi:hypothetical protein
MINQRFRLLCAESFDESHRINCNHHHLADVESLDIEIKHKNYLKNYFSSSSLFSPRIRVRLFTLRGGKGTEAEAKEIKFSVANEKREREREKKTRRTHNISTPEKKFTLFLVQVQGLASLCKWLWPAS